MGRRKSVVANFAFQLLYQMFSTLVPFVTAPYLARTLGVQGIGIYAYNYAIAFYFVLFTKLGIENYGAKQIAKIDADNKEELSQTFWRLFFVKFVFGLISLTVYLVYVLVIVQENKGVALIFTLYILSALIDINWFYIGIENFKLISMRNIGIKTLTTILIFVFVKSANDLNIYTLIMVGGTYFLSQFVGWNFIIRKVTFYLPKTKEMVQCIKPMLALFIPVLAMSVYRQMDKVMLGNMSGTQQVGLYEYTEKIYMILITIVSACGDVGMPRVVSFLSAGNRAAANRLVDKFVDFGLFLSFAMTFGIIAISKHFIVIFYGNSFAECADLLILLAPTIVFLCVSVIIRKDYLIPYGKEQIFIRATCIGAIVNFSLNCILIPQYAAGGAILATMLTELFVMVYQIVCVRKEIAIKKYLAHAAWFAIAGTVMLLSIRRVWTPAKATVMLVAQEVLFGAVIYLVFAMVFFMKNYRSDIAALLQRIKSRVK